jgi:outer membrane receptor protein involved in Fe transport
MPAKNTPVSLRILAGRQIRLLVLTGMASSLFAIAASAQTPPVQAPQPPAATQPTATPPAAATDTSSDMEEVVVTARFRSELSTDIGSSIRAIGAQQLTDLGINSVSDLAKVTPDLNLQDRGPNRNEISIRGVGRSLFQQDLSLSNANIGLYLDDVPLNMPVGSQVDVPSFDLNRVEVLRGPQGTLFGEGAEGGAIRYVSQNPNLTEYSGRAEVYSVSTQGGGTDFGARGMVNLPLAPDVLGLRIVASHEALPGYIRNTFDNRNNTNDYDANYVRGVLLWKPTDNFQARLLGDYERSNQGALDYVSDPKTATLADFSTANNYVKDNHSIGSANLKYDFDLISVESITSYYTRERDRQVWEPTYTARTAFIAQSLGVPGAPTETSIDSTRYHQFSQEVRFISNLDGPFNFVMGAFYRHFNLGQTTDRINTDYALLAPIFAAKLGVPAPANPSPYASVLSEQLGLPGRFDAPDEGFLGNEGKQASGFLEGTYKVTDDLHLIAGIRRHEETIQATEISPTWIYFSSFAAPQNFVKSTQAKVWLPKGSIEYKWTPDLLTYVTYSEGVRNGNLNGSASVAAVAQKYPSEAGNVEVFGPEYVHAIEGGIKGTALDRKLSFDLASFYNNILDIQGYGTTTLSGSAVGIVQNIGDGHSTGFETEATYRITPEVSVFAGGNYTSSVVDTIKSGLIVKVATTPGERIPFIPEFTLSGGAHVEYPTGMGDWRAFGTAQYQYVGSYSTFITAPQGSAQNPIIGQYGLANLDMGLRNDTWGLDLRIGNVFDRRAIMSVSPVQALYGSLGLKLPAGASIDDLQMTRPRTFTATLSAQF